MDRSRRKILFVESLLTSQRDGIKEKLIEGLGILIK